MYCRSSLSGPNPDGGLSRIIYPLALLRGSMRCLTMNARIPNIRRTVEWAHSDCFGNLIKQYISSSRITYTHTNIIALRNRSSNRHMKRLVTIERRPGIFGTLLLMCSIARVARAWLLSDGTMCSDSYSWNGIVNFIWSVNYSTTWAYIPDSKPQVLPKM